MILNSSGCADYGVDAPVQLAQLLAHALAAVYRQDLETWQMPGVSTDRFRNLQGEFAGRRKNENLRVLFPEVEAAQQWQGKGCRFACAGLGLAKQILPGQQGWDAASLDG